MKKAFTMIELIFVIVILGILAAVAIPKLIATRDDAEISKYAQNLSMLVSNSMAFYISQGTYDKDISKMTNVNVIDKEDFIAELPIRDTACVEVTVYNEDDVKESINKGSLKVTPINKDNKVCKKLHSTPIISNYFEPKKYIMGKAIN